MSLTRRLREGDTVLMTGGSHRGKQGKIEYVGRSRMDPDYDEIRVKYGPSWKEETVLIQFDVKLIIPFEQQKNIIST